MEILVEAIAFCLFFGEETRGFAYGLIIIAVGVILLQTWHVLQNMPQSI